MAIYVWGTGCGASELLDQGLALDRIRAFVDNFPSGDSFLGKPVLLPGQLDPRDCELLIITARQTGAIADQCRELGIRPENCLFLKNNVFLSDRNAGCTAAGKILGKTLLEKLLDQHRIVPVPKQLSAQRLPEAVTDSDYVRLATLELLCRRLSSVPGAAAELGVYKGFFARCIPPLLPERRLYLLDTFRGFAPEAGATEAFQAAHTNTAAEKVLAALPYPDRAVLRAGFFPETAMGLQETFCLVSLDVDFSETTLEGLRYFWPRLSAGGYLLLHDWGNPGLPGVAEALTRFEQELGQPIPSVPLCDVCGSLILCK